MSHPLTCETRTYDRSPAQSHREGDYEFAKSRFHTKTGRRLERGYAVAGHFAEVIKARKREEGTVESVPTLEKTFQELTALWWRETRILSSIEAKIFNQHYQRIIGLGRGALPLIFAALRDRGGQWYWALECITGENPAANAATLSEAKRIWLEYALTHRYL